MSFIALCCAVFLGQVGRVTPSDWLRRLSKKNAQILLYRFNDGSARSAKTLWWSVMIGLILVWLILTTVATLISPLFFWALQIFILYSVFGIRFYWHDFSALCQLVQQNQISEAKIMLAKWEVSLPITRASDDPNWVRQQLVEVALKQGLVRAQQYAYGVWFWAMWPLVGPILALLYLFTQQLYLQGKIVSKTNPEMVHPFARYAREMYFLMDYLPTRCTVLLFSLAGNFEVAVENWRSGRYSGLQAESDGIDPNLRNQCLLWFFGLGGINLPHTLTEGQFSQLIEGDAMAEEWADSSIVWEIGLLTSLSGLLLRTFLLYIVLAVLLFLILV